MTRPKRPTRLLLSMSLTILRCNGSMPMASTAAPTDAITASPLLAITVPWCSIGEVGRSFRKENAWKPCPCKKAKTTAWTSIPLTLSRQYALKTRRCLTRPSKRVLISRSFRKWGTSPIGRAKRFIGTPIDGGLRASVPMRHWLPNTTTGTKYHVFDKRRLLKRAFLDVREIGGLVGWWWFDWSVLADRFDLVKKARRPESRA